VKKAEYMELADYLDRISIILQEYADRLDPKRTFTHSLAKKVDAVGSAARRVRAEILAGAR